MEEIPKLGVPSSSLKTYEFLPLIGLFFKEDLKFRNIV